MNASAELKKELKTLPKPKASLTKKSITGLSWVFSGSLGAAILRILVLGVLARLITPEDFGIVSAVVMVVYFSELIGQVGVAPALVQKDEVTREDIATAFTLSLGMGALLGGGLYFSAPFVAGLFGNLDLIDPLMIVALAFPVRMAGIVAGALLQRAARFRDLSLINFGSYVVGYAGLSIVLAYLGWGYWALIWAQLAQLMLCNLAYLLASPHSFRIALNRSSMASLIRYGSGILIAHVGNFLGSNLDYLVVSRYLGAAALGFYSRAYYVMQQPTKLIGDVGDQVLFPLFSSIKREKERVVQAYYICTLTVFILTSFISAQIFVVAPDLVKVMLGSQWNDAVVPIQLLIISLPFRVAWKSSSVLMKSEGSTFHLALWQWIYAAMIFAGAYIGSEYGIDGVALAVALVIALNYGVSLIILRMKYPVRLRHEAAIILKCGVMAAASGVVTFSLINIPQLSAAGPLARVALSCSVGGLGLLLSVIFLEQIFPGDAAWLKIRLLNAFPMLAKVPTMARRKSS